MNPYATVRCLTRGALLGHQDNAHGLSYGIESSPGSEALSNGFHPLNYGLHAGGGHSSRGQS